jgi:DNA-directed RNA polymerase specialized sigma24 family protein
VFLILAEKAQTCRWNSSIANWLYTTARQVAFRARRALNRRIQHEVRAIPKKGTATPLDLMTGREAFLVLDEELDRLPGIYREPLVLCCLEGLTGEEASARLGWTPGSTK